MYVAVAAIVASTSMSLRASARERITPLHRDASCGALARQKLSLRHNATSDDTVVEWRGYRQSPTPIFRTKQDLVKVSRIQEKMFYEVMASMNRNNITIPDEAVQIVQDFIKGKMKEGLPRLLYNAMLLTGAAPSTELWVHNGLELKQGYDALALTRGIIYFLLAALSHEHGAINDPIYAPICITGSTYGPIHMYLLPQYIADMCSRPYAEMTESAARVAGQLGTLPPSVQTERNTYITNYPISEVHLRVMFCNDGRIHRVNAGSQHSMNIVNQLKEQPIPQEPVHTDIATEASATAMLRMCQEAKARARMLEQMIHEYANNDKNEPCTRLERDVLTYFSGDQLALDLILSTLTPRSGVNNKTICGEMIQALSGFQQVTPQLDPSSQLLIAPLRIPPALGGLFERAETHIISGTTHHAALQHPALTTVSPSPSADGPPPDGSNDGYVVVHQPLEQTWLIVELRENQIVRVRPMTSLEAAIINMVRRP